MSVPATTDAPAPRHWPQAQPPRSRLWQALGTAATLEAVAVGGLLAWIALHPAAAPLKALPIEIEAVTPAPEPVVTPPAPPSKPLPPAPAPPTLRSHPSPAPRPAPAPQATASLPVSAEPSETLAAPAPVAAAAPATPPAPTPPPPPPAGPAGPSSEYIAKVKAAVQAAFIYPPAAAAMDFHGRTRVRFTLRGTTPSAAQVLVGSGMGLVDRAALQSVQAASYPPPPPEMKGAEASFEVWVEFKP